MIFIFFLLLTNTLGIKIEVVMICRRFSGKLHIFRLRSIDRYNRFNETFFFSLNTNSNLRIDTIFPLPTFDVFGESPVDLHSSDVSPNISRDSVCNRILFDFCNILTASSVPFFYRRTFHNIWKQSHLVDI